MAQSKTSTYVLTLPMRTAKSDMVALDKYFELSRRYYNAILGKLLKRIKLMRESKEYNRLRKLPKDSKERKAGFKALEVQHGIKGTELNKLITSLRVNEYKQLGSHITIKLQLRAMQAIDKMRFGDANKVSFIAYGEMTSIEGSDNRQGIKYRDGFIIFNKLNMPVIIKNNDRYAQKAIQDRVKYCRIVRKLIRGKIKYYVQLVLEGVPPTKIDKETGEIKGSLGIGDVGLDIGTQTIAIVSKQDVKLLELCPKVNNTEHRKWLLQRKLDRQRRANNPNNFSEDGTIKRGVKLTWVKSNRYIKTQNELRELQRKQAAIRKQSHEILANEIINLGDTIYVESMNYKGLQKRSKETKVNERTGKFNRKKRFGKSLANKAPAMLLTIIDRKLGYDNLKLLKINTQKCKASQYNHFTDEYSKKELKDRWSNGIEIQRDMYSAFLIMNVNNNLESINRDKCIETYDNFKKLHDREVNRLRDLKASGYKLISSMGI